MKFCQLNEESLFTEELLSCTHFKLAHLRLVWQLKLCLFLKKGVSSPLNGSAFHTVGSPLRKVFSLSSYHDSAQLKKVDVQRHDTDVSAISACNTAN